jgi:Family of unknown function (DUF5675)
VNTLKLTRLELATDRTRGALTLNGSLIAVTLEDPTREVISSPVSQWKIPGDTAIPVGTYRIEFRHSPRFGVMMPYLIDVNGFTDIMLHPGTSPIDTRGCILVANHFMYQSPEFVKDSRTAFERLMRHLKPITTTYITIT